jgi:rare lipoprotein A
MRRLSLVLCTVVLLSACGRKNVQVIPPQTRQSQTPSVATAARELEGLASYYGEPYHGRKTASGEVFDTYQHLTAAHRTLPFNTFVRVTNKANGRAVDVRINDRGPFVDGRVIDISVRAAREIDMMRSGVTPVILTILKRQPATGSAYAVQVGAFEDQRTAEDLKQQLEKKYSRVIIQTVTDNVTLYRVRITQPDLDSANRIASELRKSDFKPFVVRLN